MAVAEILLTEMEKNLITYLISSLISILEGFRTARHHTSRAPFCEELVRATQCFGVITKTGHNIVAKRMIRVSIKFERKYELQ